MWKELIIRAWKDPGFRADLSREQREHIPEHPSGQSVTELEEAELHDVLGGSDEAPWCGVTQITPCHPRTTVHVLE